MPPVLRSRTSGARAVSPVVKQENVKQEKKPKPKRKVKQKPETSAPKDKVEKHKGHKVEPPEESADQPMAHGQDVHQPLSSSPTEPLHVALVPDANGKRSGNNGKSTRPESERETSFILLS